MRYLIFFIFVAFLSMLCAQVPCDPIDQQKDLIISNEIGKADFNQYLLQPIDAKIDAIYRIIVMARTSSPAGCDSSWHKVRTITHDILRLYTELGKAELERYYKHPALQNVKEFEGINTLKYSVAVEKIENCLDELKKIIGIN